MEAIHGFRGKNRFGGLCIFWNPNTIKVEILEINSRRGIIVLVMRKHDDYRFFMTNIYALNIQQEREKFWNILLSHRKSFENEEWMILGDFNTSLNLHDKQGG